MTGYVAAFTLGLTSIDMLFDIDTLLGQATASTTAASVTYYTTLESAPWYLQAPTQLAIATAFVFLLKNVTQRKLIQDFISVPLFAATVWLFIGRVIPARQSIANSSILKVASHAAALQTIAWNHVGIVALLLVLLGLQVSADRDEKDQGKSKRQ